MNIKWVKAFTVAAKYENFRRTSEELYLTQPAITKYIKRLEEELQAQLFQRTGKRVFLTEAGYKFLPYANALVDTYEEGLEEFNLWKQGYSRKLVIASAPQIASSVLPGFIRDFTACYPSIEVIVTVMNSYEIGEEVYSGRADLGLTKTQPLKPNIESELIHQEPVCLIAPNEGKQTIDETAVFEAYRLITHNHPDYWDELLIEVKRHYPKIRTMSVKQAEATKRFIAEGLGVSYLPFTMVQEELTKELFISVPSVSVHPPQSSTYLVTKVLTSEVVEFMKFIREKWNGK